jgi:hypothetical protein
MNEVTVELASGRQNTLFSRELRDSLFSLLKRWLREPLLHFLFIGLAVFAVYAYMHRGRGGIESSRQIVLSLEELRILFRSGIASRFPVNFRPWWKTGSARKSSTAKRWPSDSIKTTPS